MLWINGLALALAAVCGAFAAILLHNGLAGALVAAALGTLYVFGISSRVARRRAARQHAYDGAPDGRLTTDH